MVDSEIFEDTMIGQLEKATVSFNQHLIDKNHLNPDSKKSITTFEKKVIKPVQKTKLLIQKNKCTKAVKNWLDDVHKKVLDEFAANSQLVVSKNAHTDKPIKVTKKKVVQTKLANKDGIMKYKKPGTGREEENIELEEACKNISQAGVADDVVKEKKSKFRAPIKSQVPVKDISFEIVTIRDSSSEKHSAEMTKVINNSEILAVLVYRNGFCQLNSSYTEDTCIPDGILLHVNERFYFINEFYANLKQTLEKILESTTLICYDGKEILTFLLKFINFRPNSILDAKIAGCLLDPENLPESFSDIQKYLSYTPEYTIATENALQKAAWYSILLKECFSKLRSLLLDNSLWKIFEEVEMQLLPIVADMERFGVSVDMEKLKSMEQVLLTKMKTVERECHEAAGKSFQINSPLQVRNLLYHDLKLDELCHIKVKETVAIGAKSTSEAALRNLMSVHPLPKLILEYRHLHKAHATFLAGIAHQAKDGVVRPRWVQIAAATGRMASNNPNLQAIPKTPFNLEMFASTEDFAAAALKFRSVYVARSGCVLLGADFMQVECRVWGAVACDRALLARLRDRDLFRALAALWLNKSEEAVSSADREQTKRVVYASLYGCGASKLMDILGVRYQQALDILASFNRTFPSLKAFGSRVLEECSRNGGRLRTLGGRVRSFPGLDSRDPAVRARAQRQAVNYIVQGSAADLCKVAMVEVQRRLSARPGAARLLLQLHDELLWEVGEPHLHWARDIVKEAMEESGQRCGMAGAGRLPVAVRAGPDWANMTPL